MRNGKKGGINSGKAKRKKKKLQQIAQMMIDVPITGTNREKLLEQGFPEEALNKQWALYIAGLMNSATKGNEKAFAKLQELANEETNKFLVMKEKELKIREREIALKEKELEAKLNQGSDNGVIIVHDLKDIDEEDS